MDLVRSFARARSRGARARERARAADRPARPLPARRAKAFERSCAHGTCDGMVLNLALDYGARRTLRRDPRAARRRGRGHSTRRDRRRRSLGYLYTAGLPDPDLLIRTGGELRVVKLPSLSDRVHRTLVHAPLARFRRSRFDAALVSYAGRQRRFGK
jgi:undecaprenyl diphosphate synthase